MAHKQASQTKAKPTFVSAPPIKEKKKTSLFSLGISSKQSVCFLVANLLFFIFLSVFFLYFKNSDTMYMIQGRSFYSPETPFWDECMEIPGGLLAIAGCYLTQFFHKPVIATVILTVMWIVTFFGLKYAFKVPNVWTSLLLIPITCLLISVIDTGYWVYYLKEPGYYMRESLGLMIVSIILLLSNISSNKIFKITYLVLVSATYPLMGWFSLLAVLGIVVMNYRKYIVAIASVPLIVVVPIISHYFQPTINFSRLWISGFPMFENNANLSILPELPFVVMGISILILAALQLKSEIKGKMVLVATCLQIALIFAAFYYTDKANFDNYNYHAECRIYRDAEEQDWNSIVQEAANLPGDATRQIVIFKNIALINRGDAGSQMFHYNNMGEPACTFDSLHVSMVQTAAPLMYLHHGKTNFAYRWCMENAVEFGFNFNELKILAITSLLHGENNNAKKYLKLIQGGIYQREWADKYMPIAEGKKSITEYHEFDNIRELRDHMGSVLDGDQGLVEMYLINYFSNTMNKDSKYLQEVTLIYALLQKDIQIFWPHFFLYATLHKNEEMPIHYQEAAYLYGNLEHEVNISGMPFDEARIKQRYVRFNETSQQLLRTGLTPQQVGEAMKASFGDTFWWFYFFCRDVHSY